MCRVCLNSQIAYVCTYACMSVICRNEAPRSGDQLTAFEPKNDTAFMSSSSQI